MKKTLMHVGLVVLGANLMTVGGPLSSPQQSPIPMFVAPASILGPVLAEASLGVHDQQITDH